MSAYFQTILDNIIVSKLNDMLLDDKKEFDSYVLDLKSKGLRIIFSGKIVAGDLEAKRTENLMVKGVEAMIDKNLEELDIFDLRSIKTNKQNLRRPIVRSGKRSSGSSDSTQLKLKNGVEVNPLTLKNLINQRLLPKILGRMKSPIDGTSLGWLVNRTGRLATSAYVSNIIVKNASIKTITFNYNRDPYGVFEYPTGDPSLASKGRDPRRLFANAINDVLNEILHLDSISSNVFSIRTGRYVVGKTNRKGGLIERL